MDRLSVIVVLAWLAASGCSKTPVGGPSLPNADRPSGVITWSGSDTGEPAVDRGTVFFWGSQFVVWTNSPDGGGGSTSSNMHGGSCTGQLNGANGQVLDFGCETTAGTTGTATIAEQTYDLAEGGLFLVQADGDNWRVKQLNRELGKLPPDKERLLELAKQDDEIKDFFGSAPSQE